MAFVNNKIPGAISFPLTTNFLTPRMIYRTAMR
jgi:hypothetical protein